MIMVLLAFYVAILALFIWLGFIPLNRFWKFSPLIVMVALTLGILIPVSWGAPQVPVVVARPSVAIAPDVAGEVTEIPVEANKPVKAGDILFRIDPTAYQHQAEAIEAQLKFAELRLVQMSRLQTSGAGRTFDVEQRQAEVEQLRAQLAGAQWNLDKTTVRAPADGFVTNLVLREGARVAPMSPVMAFIDTSETVVGAQVAQIYARYVEVGQPVEVTFKMFPGAIHTGRVESVIQAISTGQGQVGGLAAAPITIQAGPFYIRIALDDPELAQRLPAGTAGFAAIFTDHVRPAHFIRRILLRQVAILNYVNPF